MNKKEQCEQVSNMKTTVSLPESLFEQAEKVARKKKLSRSRLFALALKDYLRREENRDLLAKINSAYAHEPDSTEQTLRRKVRGTHRRIVNGNQSGRHILG